MSTIPATLRAPDSSALARVARRFEAQALSALLKPVFGEAPKGLLSGGPAEDQWRPMLVEQHARAWTERGGIGIAASVHAELLRAQAAQAGDGAGGVAGAGNGRAAAPSIARAPVLPASLQEGARR
ncbi:chemotaxis protein chel [Roseomonas nepalensis]|uniref:Chemotaxis protein chel n=1 Tax=Muricoccus nepalensis TaxID=1854500 RepID=A0A502GBC7_9PROT|nr:rod-binding protein [Roseomonas nepalensis]TPG59567.1 chemotaxis protein chel [Roseomonas nepalensis]